MTTESPFRALFLLALDGGPLTTSKAAELVGCDTEVARRFLCRLVKSKLATVARVGKRGQRTVVYTKAPPRIGDADERVDVFKPSRKVLTVYPKTTARDPWALPPEFFGRRQA